VATYTPGAWLDRVSEDPTKRRLTIVSDSSSTLSASTQLVATVERADTATQEGTAFNATNMDALETRIEDAFKPCMTYTVLSTYTDGKETGLDALPSVADKCSIIEIFYADGGKADGITSQRIHITNYDTNNYISLDSISCGTGSNNSFYLKTATYNIRKQNNSVTVRRVNDRTKRLVYENGSFRVETSSIIDLKIYKIIGYRIDT
jgi:hypothetical protein